MPQRYPASWETMAPAASLITVGAKKSGPAQYQTMWAIGKYTTVNHATTNTISAENFTRSANAPTISAGVMQAKVIWKMTKTYSGM